MKSTALPMAFYGDPLTNLISLEGKTCKGCKYEFADMAFGVHITVCTFRNAEGSCHKHGTRCKHYDEKGAAHG